MSAGQRFFIETWGCQMNELDSQRMHGQLMQQSLLPTRDVSEADVILLNSCSVREKAQHKAYSRLGEYRLLKRRRPEVVIGFCGCVAEQEGAKALKRVPELDFVLGTGRISELADVVRSVRTGSRPVVTGFPSRPDYDFEVIHREGAYKGMVTIVEGCNKRCTFCVVPTTRGPERCRPLNVILEEVRHLVDYGFVEIELLGQTVNHWRSEDSRGELDFADLLDAVALTPGLRRLRFVTSYPRDFTPRMVASVGRHENICPYLHLPVQSGSDPVLQRMGRGYTVDDYRLLVTSLRRARSGLALSTDIIVGFPGESEDDFQRTLDLIDEIRFSGVFAFKYSPRPGTAALRLDDEIDDEVASRRLQDLFGLQARIQLELNRELEGATLEVLVTGVGKGPGTLTARTTCHRVVVFPVGNGSMVWRDPVRRDPAVIPRPGQLTRVVVERAFPHSLLARQARSGETRSESDTVLLHALDEDLTAPFRSAPAIRSAHGSFRGRRSLDILSQASESL